MGAGLVGDDVDRARRGGAARGRPRRSCRPRRPTRPGGRPWPPAPSRRARRGRRRPRRGSGARPGGPAGPRSTSTIRQTPPFRVTASGWAPPMPPQPPVSVERAGQGAAEPLLGDGGEGLVGALDDALGADVDPGAGGHLAVHGQAELLQPAELRPGRPVADQVGVGQDHPRRPLVGAHHADRPAGLDQHGLVRLQRGQGADHRVEGAPVPRGPAGAAVDDEVVGPLGVLRDRGCSSASAAVPRWSRTRAVRVVPRGARTGRAPSMIDLSVVLIGCRGSVAAGR